MWILVLSQLRNAKSALVNPTVTARVVISLEKKSQCIWTEIDSDCENYIALFIPVAIDLRLVLSIPKLINTERIEFCWRNCTLCSANRKHGDTWSPVEMFGSTKWRAMLKQCWKTLNAFTEENSRQAGMVFSIDNEVDNLSWWLWTAAKYVVEHPDDAFYVLHLGSTAKIWAQGIIAII